MSALFALTMVLTANSVSPGIIPPQYRGQWHADDAPCNEPAAPGHMSVFDRALTFETEDDEIEFGVRRVHKFGNREMLAIGTWRENSIDNRNTRVRLSLSRDRNWLTLRLVGWRKRYARCPKPDNP